MQFLLIWWSLLYHPFAWLYTRKIQQLYYYLPRLAQYLWTMYLSIYEVSHEEWRLILVSYIRSHVFRRSRVLLFFILWFQERVAILTIVTHDYLWILLEKDAFLWCYLCSYRLYFAGIEGIFDFMRQIMVMLL